MIQVNLVDFYYTKLYKLIRTSSFIKSVNTDQISDLFVYTQNWFCWFHLLLFSHNFTTDSAKRCS